MPSDTDGQARVPARAAQPRRASQDASATKPAPVQRPVQRPQPDPGAPASLSRPEARFLIQMSGGRTWYAAIPGRLWFAFRIMAAPFNVAGWILDKAVSALVIGVAAVLWAWWTQRIPDDQVSAVLGQLGSRLLGIVSKAGIL